MTASVTDTAPGQGLDPDLRARYEELTERARGLRAARRLTGPPLLLVAGAVLVSLGLLLVALGWLGASRTIYVFEQLPYLISGGLFGGCLVVAGSLAYFGYWVTKVHEESRRTAEGLERMEALMAVLVERTPEPGKPGRSAR